MELDSTWLVYATGGVILLLIFCQMPTRSFDPFAPIWVFLVGYAQIYVIQALSYREWGLEARGEDTVALADLRAFWALLWFLAVYHCGLGRVLARGLPAPPTRWSPIPVWVMTPFMIALGLLAAGWGAALGEMSYEENLLRSFPLMMQVAGVILIVTGRNAQHPRPVTAWAGVGVVVIYTLIWIFNGKRSPALIAVLTGVAAYYVPRFRRPSKPVLLATAFLGALVVALAIGWRGNKNYEQSISGFVEYLSEFRVSSILVSLNMKDREEVEQDPDARVSYETEEWGGYLLMLATVPMDADYDYGTPYIRILTTYITRNLWPDKPVFGRDKWIAAWIAGSEFPRDESFTGPAIGILGALQLNGGAVGTVIVLGVIALLIRTSYDYFRLHERLPWAQAWWCLTFVNAWLMTVNDDPFVWFYYIYGFTTLPPLLGLWIYNRYVGSAPGFEPRSHWMRESGGVGVRAGGLS
jgi:hypothetical protein